MKSQITTKRGDAGETRGLDGGTYWKTHPIVEAGGTLDELRAHLALCRQLMPDADARDTARTSDFLLWLLEVCFHMGAQISDPRNERPQYRKGDVAPRHLARLEAEQAWLEAEVKLPRAFIVSAANTVAAHLDVACTVARRFERRLVALKLAVPEFDATHLLAFANRLSDYLFMLARFVDGGEYQTVDYNCLDA